MKKILFLDIDDTLLITNYLNLFITINGVKKKISTHEYSNLTLTDLKGSINYEDFDNSEKIKNSFDNCTPLYKNLKIIDDYVKNGWELGVLTARGEENTIRLIMKNWLKKYLKNDFKLEIKNIYAVGDKNIKYNGKNSSMKKINILKKYLIYYNRVCLIDDSDKTINSIKKTNLEENLNIEYIHV